MSSERERNVVRLPLLAPLRRLATLGDELAERYEQIREQSWRVAEFHNGTRVASCVDDLPDERVFDLTPSERSDIAHAQALFAQLDAEDAYGDYETLKPGIISDELSPVVDHILTERATESESLVHLLYEYIADAGLSFIALRTGLVELVAARRKAGSIEAVMDKLAEHQERWQRRCAAIFHMTSCCNTNLMLLHKLRDEIEPQVPKSENE
jgi:hypothetical protein